MKNIHILPTDKPSRLKQNKITKKISLVTKGIDLTSYTPINIYITSDEEIKEGDWGYSEMDGIGIWNGPILIYEGLPKKIILTTDQSLDGVQSIDDEFLEWFVQNPSCDFVEIERGYLGMWGFCKSSEIISKDKIHYKIIIPKEEPKQEILEEAAEIGKFAEKKYLERLYSFQKVDFNDGVFEGAEWQAERMYSEEEVLELLRKAHFVEQNIDEWFEQFKK